jgi:hypothetical protein
MKNDLQIFKLRTIKPVGDKKGILHTIGATHIFSVLDSNIIYSYLTFISFIIFIHLVVCLTTGPKPLPKRAVHIARSRASSFK